LGIKDEVKRMKDEGGGRKFIVIMGGLENSNPTLKQVQGF